MSLDVVESALAQIVAGPNVEGLDICWLTGEPLILGIDYFRKVVDVCNRNKPTSGKGRFIVQTNGTLLNDDWASFFAENDFTVGVSIDGPKHLHDSQRITKSKSGSFDKASAGIELLVKYRVQGGALCVITKKTLNTSPDELFNFFWDRKIAWSYLVEGKIGDNADSSDALSLEDRPKLRAFLSRLLDLWGNHPSAYLRDFDQLARRLFGENKESDDRNNQGCLDIINVTAESDFFWGNPELMSATRSSLNHVRWNLKTSNVWTVRKEPTFKSFQRSIHAGIAKCANECVYYEGCRGGNPAHKFYTTGSFETSDHLTCRLNDQIIADLMLEKFKSQIAPV